MTSAIRQHLLYVDAGGIDVQVVMRDLPVVFTPQLMPSLFRGRTAADTPGQLVAAGDFEQVRQRIEPLLGRIVQSRTWVVALDQAVTVMAHWEPDAEEFEAWLQLGRDVRAALERPSTGEVQPRPTPTSDPIR